MKRITKLMFGVLCLAMSCCFAQTSFANTPIQVIVGGEEVVTNVRPVIVQDRVMLPVRAVFEALDATVKYEQATQKITAKRLSTTVEFAIGSNIMKVNGEAKEIDVAPIVVNNRTLVPLRACSEAFGLDVKWDAKAGIARIIKPVSMLERNFWERHEYNTAGELSYLLSKSLEDYGDKWENLTRPTEHFYEYDEFGNLKQEINRNGAQEYKYVYTNEYDEKNRRIRYTRDEYSPYSPDKSVETIVYTVKYNDYNQPIYAEGTNGYVETWEYNENGQLLHTKRNNTPYEEECRYDENGNLVYRQTPHETVFTEYNEAGQMTLEKVYFPGADLNGSPTTTHAYKYDDDGRVTEMVVPFGSYLYSYNELGLKTEERIVRTNGAGTTVTTYDYDENGNLIAVVQGEVAIERYTPVYK